jgi:hypothetical protein
VIGRDFESFLLEAVDDGLSSLGESSKQTIYYHLEKSFNVRREDIPTRVNAFTQAIENIFGVGANFVEVLIMKKLYEKIGGILVWNESERFGFIEYLAKARRAFNEKNTIRTLEELIECEETKVNV